MLLTLKKVTDRTKSVLAKTTFLVCQLDLKVLGSETSFPVSYLPEP